MSRLEQVTSIVARVIEQTSGQQVDLSPDEPLLSSGFLDSLATLDLFAELQLEFGVELDVEDVTESTFANTASIAALIDRRLTESARSL